MRTGRPVAKIELSAEVTSILEGYTRRGKTAQSLALRARIVLGCASGLSNKAVAARERVTGQTVGKWRRRFLERGIDGLLDEPRPGVPRKIDDAKVRDIVGLYLDPPDRALVLCVDEKSQIQALDRTQPLLPMRPGQVERRS